MHTAHADPHEVGLVDGCPACEAHAQDPFKSLDAKMLSNLVTLAIHMREGTHTYNPRSYNEAVARANVMNALERAGKMFEVMQLSNNLDVIVGYYQRYWRVDI